MIIFLPITRCHPLYWRHAAYRPNEVRRVAARPSASRRLSWLALFVLILLLALMQGVLMRGTLAQPATIEYTVEARYPHDRKAYTQGLVWHQGALYESTGLRGQSSLRKVRLRDGRVTRLRSLGSSLFAEGIAVADNQIVQLTWTSQVLLRYQLVDFSLLDRIEYPYQGWGIAFDGERFIVSDGSATLRFLDPQSLEVIDQITVFDEDLPLSDLNELEFVGGQLFANVWRSERIARIDVESGAVTGWLDLSQLVADESAANDTAEILNGIAWLPDSDLLLVTGKFWSHLYAIKLLN